MCRVEPPLNPRYESLDVWRGVACLLVVIFHSTAGYMVTPEVCAVTRSQGGSWADWALLVTNWGWAGVPLFFVISGYCIAASADSARRKPQSGFQFFVRRFRRIYPPLWAYLAVTALGTALLFPGAIPGPIQGFEYPLPYPQYLKLGQWIGTLTLTESWRYHVIEPEQGYMTASLWSLCYEEQFYLIVGIILAVCRRWFFLVVGVITVFVCLNVFDFSAFFGELINAYRRPLSGFFFDGLWLPFASGVGVYYQLNYARQRVRWTLDLLLLYTLAWCVLMIGSFSKLSGNVPGYLGIAVAFALALKWLHPHDSAIATSRITAPLRFCGRMCYSLYLVHAPICGVIAWNFYRWGINTPELALMITTPTCLTVSTLVSYGFHRLVENRFLNAPVSAKPVAALQN